MSQKVKSIFVFNNLNVAVFDEDGKQIAEAQVPLIQLLCHRLGVLGYDSEGAVVETQWGKKFIVQLTHLDYGGYRLEFWP